MSLFTSFVGPVKRQERNWINFKVIEAVRDCNQIGNFPRSAFRVFFRDFAAINFNSKISTFHDAMHFVESECS